MSIKSLIESESTTNLIPLHKSNADSEMYGPCPFCNAGEDRFRVWPAENRYWCRVCEKKGDSIQFLRDYKHLSFAEAKAAVDGTYYGDQRPTADYVATPVKAAPQSPDRQWSDAAGGFLLSCQAALWAAGGAKALDWLRGRGMADSTIKIAGLGYCDHDHYVDRRLWGLPDETQGNGKPKGLWLPRGIVIPWQVDGELWGIRIRRPVGDPKYYFIPGGQASGLYNAGLLTPNQPAIIVEGEIDALTICQAGYTAVATGSTQGARRAKWLARLAQADAVLVAFDNDDAGNTAAQYWCDNLPNARRWRPFWADVNQLQQDGIDVCAWIAAGIGNPPLTPVPLSSPLGDTETPQGDDSGQWLLRGLPTLTEALEAQKNFRARYGRTCAGMERDGTYYVRLPWWRELDNANRVEWPAIKH